LAGFQQKGFPKGLTETIIWADHMEGEPRPPSFLIMPENGTIQYDLGDRWSNSLEDILADRAAVEYAWDCLALLGIDRTQFIKTNIAGFGVAFPRQIDGIRFQDESEGFSLQQFGKERKLRDFGLTLPTLHRTKEDTTASPQEIITCIRAFKTPLVPSGEEANYFGRVKNMAKAQTLTITKLTLYYSEGVYGEEPTNDPPAKWVTPVAQLEAIATFETTNAIVRLYSPILSSEVLRVLGNNHPATPKRKSPP
jgi:hypothetical protein